MNHHTDMPGELPCFFSSICLTISFSSLSAELIYLAGWRKTFPVPHFPLLSSITFELQSNRNYTRSRPDVGLYSTSRGAYMQTHRLNTTSQSEKYCTGILILIENHKHAIRVFINIFGRTVCSIPSRNLNFWTTIIQAEETPYVWTSAQT